MYQQDRQSDNENAEKLENRGNRRKWKLRKHFDFPEEALQLVLRAEHFDISAEAFETIRFCDDS